MANFAVAADQSVIDRGNKIIDQMQKPGEKKGETLARLFALAEDQLDNHAIQSGGVDVAALDAAIGHIKSAFLAAVSGREEITKAKDEEIAAIKKAKDALERELRDRIEELDAAKQDAEQVADAAARRATQTEKEAQAAKEQAETATSLAAEKDRTIATLAEKLSVAESKAAGYDDLNKEAEDLRRQIIDVKKDAELDKERAVRDAEIENARLTAKIELLEAQIADLRDKQ